MTKDNLSPLDKELIISYRRYITYQKRLSDKTREVYSREAAMYLSYLNERGKKVEDIGPGEIEEYLIKRRIDDNVDERTEGRILSSLRSFYSFLSVSGAEDRNPAKLVEKPKEREHLPRVITEEEVDELMSSFPKDDILSFRDYTLFELIYSSGMRISEAVSLDVSSYRSEEGTISVIGKRDKERIVFIGEASRAALDSYLDNVRPKLMKNPREKALFLNRRGGRLTRQAAHKRFHETAEKIGLDATIHTLRHSFASHMISRGADVRSVQEMLGHSDVRTTQIYTHLDTSSLLAFFDKFSPLENWDDDTED